ncbi:Med5-domain-containing protein [Tothia fuscella]|uniref:Mediator of RNA polymerase II transcription subunit 5 n=1 Tax=Tothia fuscella TaxID=1048955 RepID=A0A9P4NUG1_9PEZI|nr:Med5-domain-containing protein [Tothia fuscella]
MDATSQLWTTFLNACLEKRLRSEQFDQYASELSNRSPIMGAKLANILVGRQTLLKEVIDPLLPAYADSLLESNRVSSADLLGALLKRSRYYHSSKVALVDAAASEDSQLQSLTELDAIILDQLCKAYSHNKRPKTQEETRVALRILSEWLTALAIPPADAIPQSMEEQEQYVSVCDSIAMLALAMLENPKVTGIILTALPKETRKALSRALTSFTVHWTEISAAAIASQASSPEQNIPFRLANAQKNLSLVQEVENDIHQDAFMDIAAASQVNAIQQLGLDLDTRPGAFVFISSLLSGRPLIEENMMLNYLHVKYKHDMQALTVDLIVAGFDVLSSAEDRKEPESVKFSLKSFLINKIPTLIAPLAASIYPHPEHCITKALHSVDLNTFPLPGVGQLTSSTLQNVRQEFLYSCVLHGILPAASIGRLLTQGSFSSPPSPDKRLFKELLIQQCATEPGKAVQLINGLENLDGNAGQIVLAVTEVIRDSCSTKDTMALKSICNALCKKPQSLDVWLQFTSPISVLQPLCQLLDAWRYEDDQGEYQPVYDEFASIFLLVLVFIYRYNLTATDLGVSPESFIAQYISHGHTSIPIDELTEEQSKYLESWAKGLFGSDGITEEVTSSCRPQQFYMIVPTLFNQTLLACAEGHITMSNVKMGLEYLLEPFLLPSLVGAILWMGAYSSEQLSSDLDALLQMLQRVTQAPTSSDAQAMHAIILSIVSQPLLGKLRDVRRKHAGRKDVESMISMMKSHSDFRRGTFSACPELKVWRKSPGSLRQTVRSTYRDLIHWHASSTINPTQQPPHYHPRLFAIAEGILGAEAVLSILIEELKVQTESPDGAANVAFDIATAIVCAPTTQNSPIDVNWIQSPVPQPPPRGEKRLNLRDVLRLKFNNATEIIQTSLSTAEALVRLHRKVDAQLKLSSAPMPDLAVSMPAILPDNMNTSDVAAANAVVDAINFAQDTNAGLDLTGAVDSMALESTLDSMLTDQTGKLGEGEGNVNDDIFGDLDFGGLSGDMMDMDMDLNF